MRGVGRTGVPAPDIQDLRWEPPKIASVLFEESTSRSEGTAEPSLSGGLRMSQRTIRGRIGMAFLGSRLRSHAAYNTSLRGHL